MSQDNLDKEAETTEPTPNYRAYTNSKLNPEAPIKGKLPQY